MDSQNLLFAFIAIGITWLLTGQRNRLASFVAREGDGLPAGPGLGASDGRATFPPGVEQWRATATAFAALYGPPDLTGDLVLSVIEQESSGRADARGSAGEIGLMQLKRIAVQDIGMESVPTDPAENIRAGVRFLALQISRMDGDIYDGLRAYNQGETGARRNENAGRAYANQILSRL